MNQIFPNNTYYIKEFLNIIDDINELIIEAKSTTVIPQVTKCLERVSSWMQDVYFRLHYLTEESQYELLHSEISHMAYYIEDGFVNPLKHHMLDNTVYYNSYITMNSVLDVLTSD